MKKKLHKSITVFLCMTLLTLFVPQTTVNAYEPGDIFREGDFEYLVNGDWQTLSVELYWGDVTNLEALMIPTTVHASDGNVYNVTKISSGFLQNADALKSVIIPQGISEISEDSFGNCSQLNELTFHTIGNLTTIGSGAFMQAPLNTPLLQFPYGLTSIGAYAFHEGTPKEVLIPDTLTHVGTPETSMLSNGAEVWLEVKKNVELIGPGHRFRIATDNTQEYALEITGVKLHEGGKVTNNGDASLPVRLPDGTEIFVEPNKSYGIPFKEADVKMNYFPKLDGGKITRVDITWGALEFSYNEGGPGVWNTQTHKYDGAAEQGWKVKTDGGDLIKVDNHSNIELDVEFVYNSRAGYETITGTLSGDGITEGKTTLLTAENTDPQNPPSVTAKLTLAGTVPAGMPTVQTVAGTVTVKVGDGNQ